MPNYRVRFQHYFVDLVAVRSFISSHHHDFHLYQFCYVVYLARYPMVKNGSILTSTTSGRSNFCCIYNAYALGASCVPVSLSSASFRFFCVFPVFLWQLQFHHPGWPVSVVCYVSFSPFPVAVLISGIPVTPPCTPLSYFVSISISYLRIAVFPWQVASGISGSS